MYGGAVGVTAALAFSIPKTASPSVSRELQRAAIVIALAWGFSSVFRAVAPYGAFWGYLFAQLAALAYFYDRAKRPEAAARLLLEALLFLHVARIVLTAVGPFFAPPYWLMWSLNRLFECGLVLVAGASALAIADRRGEALPAARRALDRWLGMVVAAVVGRSGRRP